MGDGVDLGGLADGLVGCEAALAVDEVGGEDGVDEGALAESSLACIIIALSACSFLRMYFCGRSSRRRVKIGSVQELRLMRKTYQRK
jgi:hypothetical protein